MNNSHHDCNSYLAYMTSLSNWKKIALYSVRLCNSELKVGLVMVSSFNNWDVELYGYIFSIIETTFEAWSFAFFWILSTSSGLVLNSNETPPVNT